MAKSVEVRIQSPGVVEVPPRSTLGPDEHFVLPESVKQDILSSDVPTPFPAVLVSNKIGEKYRFRPVEISVSDIKWDYNSQKHRSGRNEESERISSSMKNGLYVVDAMIIVAPNTDPLTKDKFPYELAAGNGRLFELIQMGFKTVLAWAPETEIPVEVFEQIGFSSNDPLPANKIKPSDIVNQIPRVFSEGAIPDVTKEEAKAYTEGKISPQEAERIASCIKIWIKSISGRSLSDTVRSNVLTGCLIAVQDESIRDVFTLKDSNDLLRHLCEIAKNHDPSDFPVSVGNNVSPVVPQVSDGTRRGEHLFGAAVRAWFEQSLHNQEQGLPPVKTMNIVVGASKVRSDNFYQKLRTVLALWGRKFDLENFTMMCSMMKGFGSNIFLGDEPVVVMAGFINPLKQLESFGWGYKELITHDNPVSFSDIVEKSHSAGLIDDEQRGKLKKAVDNMAGINNYQNQQNKAAA